MSHEAPKIQTPEQSQASPEVIAQAFATAHHDFLKLTTDPNLHAKLIASRINPYEDTDKPGYWHIVSGHAQERIDSIRASNGDSLRLNTLELIATTPGFLFAQHALNSNAMLNEKQTNKSKEIASQFNGRLRKFANDYPLARTTDVARGLLGIVNTSIENRVVKNASADIVRGTIQGAKHEVAFGQILLHTGRKYRNAASEEDLGGTDYFVQGNYGSELSLDVKSSANDIRNINHFNGVYALDSGHIRIQSLVGDTDFHGTFFIPSELAAERAPKLDALLTQAELEQTGRVSMLTYSS